MARYELGDMVVAMRKAEGSSRSGESVECGCVVEIHGRSGSVGLAPDCGRDGRDGLYDHQAYNHATR